MDFRIVALFLTLVAVGLVNGKRYFTYTVNNSIQQPFINESIRLRIYNGRNLYNYMEDACREEPERFTNFTATFQPVPYNGYFINAINGVAGNFQVNQTYWQISNATGPLVVGVSGYIPEADGVILFNLTQSTGSHS